jgi:UDP-N-acetylmuramate dehydrogenase
MTAIEKNVSLKPFNTFGIKADARQLTVVRSVADVQSIVSSGILTREQHLVLGGGSNLLLTKDFDGLVIKNEIRGIHTINESNDTIELEVGSGENWHGFVLYSVDRGFGGIENLSLIPGTVGAAPMQNIGAYGVEVKDLVTRVMMIDLKSGEPKSLSNAACEFGYRESIFKHALKNRCFISSVCFKLTKTNHKLNTSYGAIRDVLKQNQVVHPSIKAISDAVISIRQSKLPDPAQIGNAGSFFKNPSVTLEVFEHIRKIEPDVPSFPDVNGLIKIPAGWLIEQCGWKGKVIGNIGVHKHQALVLVNYGEGKGSDLWQLAMDIQQSVFTKFMIQLQPEVNVI